MQPLVSEAANRVAAERQLNAPLEPSLRQFHSENPRVPEFGRQHAPSADNEHSLVDHSFDVIGIDTLEGQSVSKLRDLSPARPWAAPNMARLCRPRVAVLEIAGAAAPLGQGFQWHQTASNLMGSFVDISFSGPVDV